MHATLLHPLIILLATNERIFITFDMVEVQAIDCQIGNSTSVVNKVTSACSTHRRINISKSLMIVKPVKNDRAINAIRPFAGRFVLLYAFVRKQYFSYCQEFCNILLHTHVVGSASGSNR
jgi:hypothetical protein